MTWKPMEWDFKEFKSKPCALEACAFSARVEEIGQYLFMIRAWVVSLLFVVQEENFQNWCTWCARQLKIIFLIYFCNHFTVIHFHLNSPFHVFSQG